MKKVRLTIVFFILLLGSLFIKVADANAACYCFGTPEFNTCQGGFTPNICQTSGGVVYGCCDNLGECQSFPETSCTVPTVTPGPGSCTYNISPISVNSPALGGDSNFLIDSTPATCTWDAIEFESWISITSETSDPNTGHGAVWYHIDQNFGSTTRAGSITIAGTNLTHTVNQAAGSPPPPGQCAQNYTCTTDTGNNCLLSNGDIPMSCNLSGGGSGTCCTRPSSIPPPGNCTSPQTGCFGCDWQSTGVCSYNTASANNCAQGYIPDGTQCSQLSGTADYVCNGTLFPCVLNGAGQFAECTINGCVACVPNASNPNCVDRASCLATCNNSNPNVCNGICRAGASCAANETPGGGTCIAGFPLCCIPNQTNTSLSAIQQRIFCDPQGNIVSNPETGGVPNRIYTAIGCIRVDSVQGFIANILPWAIGIAGGIAILLIIYAGFMISTSAGNPQGINAGKELLTAAISGLILLIFAAFLLRLIGQDILKIPGF